MIKLIFVFIFYSSICFASSTNNYLQNFYTIQKIDSLNNYYIFYLTKNDTLYKAVNQKDKINTFGNFKVGESYDFELGSIWRQPIFINGVNVSPSVTPHITCLQFDDSTSFCLEREKGIYDLYSINDIR